MLDMGCDLLCLLFFLPDFMPALTAVVAASCRSWAFPPPVRKLLYTCNTNRNDCPPWFVSQMPSFPQHAIEALPYEACSGTKCASPWEHCLRHGHKQDTLSTWPGSDDTAAWRLLAPSKAHVHPQDASGPTACFRTSEQSRGMRHTFCSTQKAHRASRVQKEAPTTKMTPTKMFPKALMPATYPASAHLEKAKGMGGLTAAHTHQPMCTR